MSHDGQEVSAVDSEPAARSGPYPWSVTITGSAVLAGLAVVGCGRLPVPWPVAAAQLLALLAAVAAAVVDARQLRLPDRLTYPLAAAGVVAAVVFQLAGLHQGLIAGVAGGAGYALVLLALTLIVDVRMYGLGDVKLAGGLGVWLGSLSVDHLVTGFLAGQVVLVICVLIDRVSVHRVRAIPAGPALVAGAVIAMVAA